MEHTIEAFYKSVAQSPAALNQLTAGVQTPDEFIDRAVSIGSEQGYQFTRDEASTWINNQIEARKNGELSDVQLEGVAGGKVNPFGGAFGTLSSGISSGASAVLGGAKTVSGGITSAQGRMGSWFSAW